MFNWSSVGGPAGADPGDDKHVHRVLRSEKREREVDEDQITLADGGTLLDDGEPDPTDVATDHGDVAIEHVEEKTQPDTVALTINALVTETVTPDDPAALPDFDVYCSVIDASTTTVSRLVQEQEVGA